MPTLGSGVVMVWGIVVGVVSLGDNYIPWREIWLFGDLLAFDG